jgi:monoamine oxidase
VRLDRPWASAHAAELDTWTVAAWAAAHVATPIARKIVGAQLADAGGWSASSVSLLFALFVARAAGGIEALTSTHGVLRSRVVGGTGLLVDALARDLGDRLLLQAPVRRIEWTAKGVVVRSDRGSYAAEHAIVAVPPGIAGGIEYEPALPPARAQLMQRAPMGWAIKVFAAYDAPFWRDRGLNGQAQSDRFPVVATFDESPASGAPGVIFGLIAGRNAQRWASRPPAVRRALVLRQYATLFGAEAAKPIGYVEVDWALQPYVRGGAAMFLQPGTLTEFGPALRASVGRLHWASTETATRFWGDMDGAIGAGERAAASTLR